MIWFYSDPHFWHARIIKLCERPFDSVEEMNEKLIRNYQELVKPGDKVYFLGDFGFQKSESQKILRRLPGEKHIIIGNHDWDKTGRMSDKRRSDILSSGVSWVKDTHLLKLKDFHAEGKHQYVWLAHYPHLTWPRRWNGSWHLFGHSHGNCKEARPLSLDVGVDCWDYKPVSLNQVAKYFRDNPAPKND